MHHDGGDLHIVALRVSVGDGKSWRPSANQIEGVPLWRWVEENGAAGMLSLGIQQGEHGVAVPLASVPSWVFLGRGRDSRLVIDNSRELSDAEFAYAAAVAAAQLSGFVPIKLVSLFDGMEDDDDH